MNKNKGAVSEMQFAPLRSLDDFILGAARFQLPNFGDLEKWGNRVSSNLLYYQSNYFLASILIFTLVGIIHPEKMAYGILTTAVVFLIFIYVTNEKTQAAQFKRKYPVVSVFVLFGGIYLVAYMFRSLLVFSLGIMLPFAATFLHASLRLRNLKNKLANKVETLGLRTTPMGLFLEQMGFDSEFF